MEKLRSEQKHIAGRCDRPGQENGRQLPLAARHTTHQSTLLLNLLLCLTAARRQCGMHAQGVLAPNIKVLFISQATGEKVQSEGLACLHQLAINTHTHGKKHGTLLTEEHNTHNAHTQTSTSELTINVAAAARESLALRRGQV